MESPSFSTPRLVFLPSMHGKTLRDKTTSKLGKLYFFRSSDYGKTFTSQPQALNSSTLHFSKLLLALWYWTGWFLSSFVAVTWIASVMHHCLQKRWPWLRDGHQTNTSFSMVLQQGKIMQFKFLCNWENMIKLSTASSSATQYKSLHNKITFFESFIRRKRSCLMSSCLTILSVSEKHRLGGCISSTTSSFSAAMFMQELGPCGLNTTLHYPRTKSVRLAINYHSQKSQTLFHCRLGFQFCSRHQY